MFFMEGLRSRIFIPKHDVVNGKARLLSDYEWIIDEVDASVYIDLVNTIRHIMLDKGRVFEAAFI